MKKIYMAEDLVSYLYLHKYLAPVHAQEEAFLEFLRLLLGEMGEVKISAVLIARAIQKMSYASSKAIIKECLEGP